MSTAEQDLVQALRHDPSRTAILVDFDGTLAPIVDDPAAATPLPGVVDALVALQHRYQVVGVVSGRPVRYLQGHLPGVRVLVGLYGLEEVRDGKAVTLGGAEVWRPVIDELARRASDELPPGVGVEHKGLSLTLHVRQHADMASAVDTWATAAATRTGLVVRGAKMSCELHPPVPTDKGTVVRSLLGSVAAACFIGDDVGDSPAFDALDDFADQGGAAVRFVVESSELDPGLRSRADGLLADPPAVLELLRSLAR